MFIFKKEECVTEVIEFLHKLSTVKASGLHGLTGESLKYANIIIQVLLSICFTCMFNPIRSGGGFKSPPPPPIFCSHAFNVGAVLLCVGDFSQIIV